MSEQLNLYGRGEMARTMRRSRDDFENEKAGEMLNSLEFQCKSLAKKGHSVALIARILKLNHRTVTGYLLK